MFFTIVAVMVSFGIFHSILASGHMKQTLRRFLGERAYEGFYRIGYNFVAFVTLLPAIALVMLQPGNVVWKVEGTAQLVLVAIQGAGVIGVIVSLMQIDVWRFAGLKQLMAYINYEDLPLPDEALQTGGLYRLVRHPLYLFSLMVIWPISSMGESWLAFNIVSTIYFALGSILEERKLTHSYGDIYRQYQQEVSWLIPLPKSWR
ncbi:MAG: NnrU family protein [Anaerolineae bacterium]